MESPEELLALTRASNKLATSCKSIRFFMPATHIENISKTNSSLFFQQKFSKESKNYLIKECIKSLCVLSCSVQFSSVAQSCPTLCDHMNRACQASLSITISRSSLRLTAIKSVMPSSHLILGRPLLLLPPIPPSIRVFSNESTLHMRWPKYWCFSFSIIPSKEIPGLISFRVMSNSL